MTSEEWIELGIIEKEVERVCKKLFNTTMFNFACLMNNTYRDKHFGYNFGKWSLSKIKRQKDIFTKMKNVKIHCL